MKIRVAVLAALAALGVALPFFAQAATVPDAQPYTNVSATGGSVDNDYTVPRVSGTATSAPFGNAYAESDLTYYFTITDTLGSTGLVPVRIQASGNVSRTAGSANGSGALLIHAINDAAHPATDYTYFVNEDMNTANNDNLISLDLTRNLDLNAIYMVQMTTRAQTSGGTATTFLDPHFTVGSAYNLAFSSGIGNLAAAPIPAALPLFGSGLGALGLAGWHRRRRFRIAP